MTLRRIFIAAAVAVLSAVGLFAAWQQIRPAPPSLASFMPSGALLYIQSPDFQSLLADWNKSPEKQSWLKSDNYAVFSNSRLFGRLNQAQSEFAAAAGIPSDMPLIAQIAGKQSALAWYDIGKLQFLYITRLSSTSFDESRLWQARGAFSQRQIGSASFYVRTDPKSKRAVAFASTGDWVILGTREDLVANALALINGSQQPTVQSEPWFADSVKAANKAAKSPGDLRMVLNLAKIVPSPYFRSYWIQQNITDMSQYRAAISDLYRSGATWREERILLRQNQDQPAPPASDVAALASAVPASAGFYRVQASPTPAQAVAVLRDKLLDPRPASSSQNLYAPTVTVSDQNAGSATDLDTRIDQPPIVSANDPWSGLNSAFASTPLQGLLEVQSSSTQTGGIFTRFSSAVVLTSAIPWNTAQIQKLIADGLNAQMSTSHLGAAWIQKGTDAQLSGLLPLYLAVRGNTLILSNNAALRDAISANLHPSTAVDSDETYASAFNHAQEGPTFLRLSKLLDNKNQNPDDSTSDGSAPAFFSGNIASLSRMFSGVASESITQRDTGPSVTQTVIYQWK